MRKNYNNLSDKSIEDSILQVKNSMNRLRAAIHNNNTYSSNNIHYNYIGDNNNNSMIKNPRFNDYQKNSNNQYIFKKYLNNSNRLNQKENKYDRQDKLNKKVLNNSIITETDSRNNRNYNNNEMLKAYNTEYNNINQSSKFSNNNTLKPKNIKLNNNIASNKYRSKVLNNPYNSNTITNRKISYYNPIGVPSDAKSESNALIKKKSYYSKI